MKFLSGNIGILGGKYFSLKNLLHEQTFIIGSCSIHAHFT